MPNGAGEPFVAGRARPASGDYVLAVGTLEPRKNLPAARRGDAPARRRAARRRRAAAGATSRSAATACAGSASVDDEELARLYRGALCVAYPSLYEGFGLPVLEAMPLRRAGRDERRHGAWRRSPTARPCSSTRSTRRAIAAGIESAIARRDELRGARARARRGFTWDARAPSATAAVYRELA